MTTITLSSPERNGGEWAVFGSYVGDDDRYVFGVRKFPRADGARAEACARRMMETFGADHFERTGR